MTIERLAPKIATYIFTRASVNTSTGNWHVSFEEINAFYSHYNIKLEKDSELLSAIEDALYSQYGDAILDMEIYDDEFDLVLGFDYCIEEVDFEDDDREDD